MDLFMTVAADALAPGNLACTQGGYDTGFKRFQRPSLPSTTSLPPASVCLCPRLV